MLEVGGRVGFWGFTLPAASHHTSSQLVSMETSEVGETCGKGEQHSEWHLPPFYLSSLSFRFTSFSPVISFHVLITPLFMMPMHKDLVDNARKPKPPSFKVALSLPGPACPHTPVSWTMRRFLLPQTHSWPCALGYLLLSTGNTSLGSLKILLILEWPETTVEAQIQSCFTSSGSLTLF